MDHKTVFKSPTTGPPPRGAERGLTIIYTLRSTVRHLIKKKGFTWLTCVEPESAVGVKHMHRDCLVFPTHDDCVHRSMWDSLIVLPSVFIFNHSSQTLPLNRTAF